MAARYHISADGVARQCRAKTPEACRATIASMRGQHFDSKPEAEQAYEKVMEEKKIKTLNRKKKLEERQQRKADLARHNALKDRNKAEAAELIKETAEVRASLNVEFLGKEKTPSIGDLKKLRERKNELVKKSKNKTSRLWNDISTSPSQYTLHNVSESIARIEIGHLSGVLEQRKEKLGLMDKVFKKDEERDELLVESAIDTVKGIYDPTYKSYSAKSALQEEGDKFVRHFPRSEYSNFARQFIKKERMFGQNVVVVKMSDENFPVKGRKDYVHFADLDMSNNEDDRKELLSIHEKLSSIETKMSKYDQMLKERGEDADPEIVQSARMTYSIGQQKAKDIIEKVHEENRVRREVEEFHNRSIVESKQAEMNEELNEVSLDLYHELKSTSF